MAARGSIAKETITKKILETFPNSFIYDKLIRIPIEENGETVEVKVTLTAAKDVVGDNVAIVDFSDNAPAATPPVEQKKVDVTYTKEEEQNLAELLKALNL